MTKINIVYTINSEWNISVYHNDWLVSWKKTIYKVYPFRSKSEIANNCWRELRKTELYSLEEVKKEAIKIENKRHKKKILSINNL